MTEWMFLLGLGVLTLAFRSYDHPLLQRLGVLGILVTSFCAGWFTTGQPLVGLLFALVWPALPWLELLTRVRHLRLPMEKNLHSMPPPSSNTFPALNDLTEEVEAEGFEFLRDAGWEWDEFRQHFRIFYREEDRAHAAICLSSQSDVSFYYISISSRDNSGRTWMTWTYPFPATMKLPPSLVLNRQKAQLSFFDMYQNHIGFLSANFITSEDLMSQNEESITSSLEEDLKQQITHNLRAGILKPAEENSVRYSFRGLFFIWTQFLADILRAR